MSEKRRGPGRPPGTTRGGDTPGRHVRVGQVWDDLAAHYAPETMSAVVNRLLDQEAARLRAAGEIE